MVGAPGTIKGQLEGDLCGDGIAFDDSGDYASPHVITWNEPHVASGFIVVLMARCMNLCILKGN